MTNKTHKTGGYISINIATLIEVVSALAVRISYNTKGATYQQKTNTCIFEEKTVSKKKVLN